jgi:glycine cleavage system H protein
MKILEDLLYTKEHDWIRAEGNKAYIGITDFAQHALGDIVFVELPELDTEFNTGDSYGVVESVKAASDLFVHMDGIVVEINEKVTDDPALLNTDPYENWLICLELKDSEQLKDLLDNVKYELYCSKEE